MRIYNFIIAFFAASLSFVSCTKHPGDILDHVPVATLTISKPLEGSFFNAGDSVSIQGIAISTETIHGYDVIVKKANDTATLFSVHIHDHNDTLHINEKWKASINASTFLEAVITLVLDHDGHTLTRRAGFNVK